MSHPFRRWPSDLRDHSRRAVRIFVRPIAAAGLAVVLALLALYGAAVAALVLLFVAATLAAAVSCVALARASQWAATGWRSRFLSARAASFGSFRSPREIAWTFATVTGTVGLLLLLFLQTLPAEPRRATGADTHLARRPLTLANLEPVGVQLAQAGSNDEIFGGLPDPFEPFSPPAQAEPEPPQRDDPALPFDAALDVEVTQTNLPTGVARFDLPDDEEEFLVVSTPAAGDPSAFPPDEWRFPLARDEIDRDPVLPAAYRAPGEPSPPPAELPAPAEQVDRFVPETRLLGVTVQKFQPRSAVPSDLLWYDLLVTNRGDEAIPALLVEERVSAPHRVADAIPPAAFDEGALTWRLDGLAPGEERRLTIAIYPMSSDRVATHSLVRPVATFSAVTLVEAEAIEPSGEPPLIEEPPADFPEPIAQPEPTIEPLRRIRLAMTTPERAASGAACEIRFAVTNTGELPLSNVLLRGQLPETLHHTHGPAVEANLGQLGPGETKTALLRVTASNQTGEAELIAEVATAENVSTTVRGAFEIVEPRESVSILPCNCSEPAQ